MSRAVNAVEKLRNLIRRHLEEFQRDQDMALVYHAVTRQHNRLVKKEIKEMSKMYLDIVAEVVEQGQAEGTIRKDLYLSLVKRYILGAVDEIINTWLHSGGKYDLVSMADPLIDLFIRGIGNIEAVEPLQYSNAAEGASAASDTTANP